MPLRDTLQKVEVVRLPFRVLEFDEDGLIAIDRNFKEIETKLSQLQSYMNNVGFNVIAGGGGDAILLSGLDAQKPSSGHGLEGKVFYWATDTRKLYAMLDSDVLEPAIEVFTAADFDNIRNNLEGNYILRADIDLSGYANWQPIGTATYNPYEPDFEKAVNLTNAFKGRLNGNGHKITGLTINNENEEIFIGLFGAIHNAEFINIALEDISITASSCERTGGLVGWCGGGLIADSYVTGNIEGKHGIGLITGGTHFGTQITQCYTAGEVKGRISVGGLAGSIDSAGYLQRSFSNANVESNSGPVGGLVGSGAGRILDCYATGTVTGNGWTGGLRGYNSRDDESEVDGGNIRRCFAVGAVSNNTPNRLGGLVGGTPTGGSYSDRGNFWDTETSGTEQSAMGEGKTTAQMKDKETFDEAGYRFESSITPTWGIDGVTNNGYPYLLWNG